MNHNTSAQCHTENGEVFMTDQSGNGHHIKQNTMKKLSEIYKVGDYVLGDGSVRPSSTGMYTYEVLKVENLERFGKPSQLLTVNKYANTFKGRSFVNKERRWSTQLF